MDWQQNLWIGTSIGLFRLPKGRTLEAVHAPAIEGQEITALTADMQNNMWIGTGKAGLMRVRNQEWQSLTAADGLSSDSVLALYEDREGSLWVGTSGGLDQLRNTKLITYATREGLPHDNTYAVAAGRDGSIFVSTRGGLARLREGRSRSIPPKTVCKTISAPVCTRAATASCGLAPEVVCVVSKMAACSRFLLTE